jgi:hypothetical protein
MMSCSYHCLPVTVSVLVERTVPSGLWNKSAQHISDASWGSLCGSMFGIGLFVVGMFFDVCNLVLLLQEIQRVYGASGNSFLRGSALANA